MGFRFRKKIKLFPGVSINLSNSGVSTSIGRSGATINLGGKRGPRVTIGIPGTGLSYSESVGAPASRPIPASTENTGHSSRIQGILILLCAVAVVALIVWIVT